MQIFVFVKIIHVATKFAKDIPEVLFIELFES